MFSDFDRDPINRRCVEEALACRDLLRYSPPPPSPIARAKTRALAIGRSVTNGLARVAVRRPSRSGTAG